MQSVFSDGAVSLHTRSLKYGKVSCSEVLGLGLILFQLTCIRPFGGIFKKKALE